MHKTIPLVTVLWYLACVTSAAAAVLRVAGAPGVTVPQNATFTQSLQALSRRNQTTIVAEREQVSRRLTTQLMDVDSNQARNRIAQEFGYCWIARPDLLCLQRRYNDPNATLDQEVEELQEVTADLYRLLSPFGPTNLESSRFADKVEFFDALKPEELAAMQNGGLPLQKLRPEQQRLWLRINVVTAFGLDIRSIKVCASMMSAWDSARLERRPVRVPANLAEELQRRLPSHQLLLQWPDIEQPGKSGSRALPLPARVPRRPIDTPADLVGSELPMGPRLPAAFGTKFPLRGGEHSLKEILKSIEVASETSISAPSYAEERRLHVYASGRPCRDVVVGICDLSGWEIRVRNPRRLELARPAPGPAVDVVDLHRKMRQVLPPAVHRAYADSPSPLGSQQSAVQMERVLTAIERQKGLDWATMAIRDLSPELRRTLANVAFMLEGRVSIDRSYVQRVSPRWFAVAPMSGYFTLDKKPIDEHPFLIFNVRRPDGTNSSWGWAVGTGDPVNR